jgi:hypothetical protein
MGLDLRVVGAPALATCVHVSLVFAKQALLPALLGDAYSPAALAILLGRLALCSAASALVCVPLATAAAAATRRPKLVVVAAIAADAWVELRFAALARHAGAVDAATLTTLAVAHGVAAAIAPLAAAALATADDGGGGGRGAVLAGRYGFFSGALLAGQVLGSALGSALFHKVSQRAPFVAGFLACVASAAGVLFLWPQEALVEESDDEDDAPPKDHLSTVVADGCRGFRVLFIAPPSRRAVLLVRAFVLAHVGAAVAPVIFPAYKQRLGMTQAQFAWLLAYAATLRCAGAAVLPFVHERHLGPRRRQRVLAISYAATAVELAGALIVTNVTGLFQVATLSILVGLGEPLVRADLMLEVPARDAAAAQGALAVVAIVSARGAGPYLYGWLFDVLGALGPVGILFIAAVAFAVAAQAAYASPAARDDRGLRRSVSKILSEFDGGGKYDGALSRPLIGSARSRSKKV